MQTIFSPDPESLTLRDLHLEILKNGVSEWNKWRLENPDVTPHLFQADLTFLHTQGITDKLERLVCASDLETIDVFDFRNCLIYESDFTGSVLVGADFSGSRGEAAKFIDCDLRLVSFEGGDFSHCDFTRSRLNQAIIGSKTKTPATYSGWQTTSDRARSPAEVFVGYSSHFNEADFSSTVLHHAAFFGANLYSCSFIDADLRYSYGFLSDRNRMTGTVRDFGEQSHGTFTDPWITLKRTYSGQRLLLCYLFLAVFLLPYFAKAVFALLRTQIYNDMHQYVPEIRQFGGLESSALWKVILGYEDGNFAVWLPAILLLFYNLVRTALTKLVSELVEEEVLSSTTPSYGISMVWFGFRDFFRHLSFRRYEYGWMYRVHQLLSYVFWLVMILSFLNLLQLLYTPVPILNI